jgi:pimeloyl-ACP methyl ester carboxylesterase
MTDLIERADPARGVEADAERIRAKIDQRIGISGTTQEPARRIARPWLIGVASFAVVIALAIPFLLPQQPSVFEPKLAGFAEVPGIESVTPLASGGLQAMAVDGDTLWVVTTLQNQLQEVDAASGEIRATYPTNARVEGVVVGGGYVWLMSTENDGEVLRFDPEAGAVDATVPIGSLPGWARWFGESLWLSNEENQLLQISPEGQIVSTRPGELKGGEGLGYLWVNDPETNLISSLSEDGTLGELVIPTEPGLQTMSGAGVRQVAEAAGKLYLMDGDYPWGTNLSVFDPGSGELETFTGLTFGLMDLTEFDGYLWVTSHTDFQLIRVDPASGETVRYPLPGKVAGLGVADDSLWATLYHPGALIRTAPDELIQTAEITADDWNRFPHRLLCTGTSEDGDPTILLEPYDWLDYGSWSVIQAQLSNEGFRVCANGYVEGEATPQQRAADLEVALDAEGITGPFVLVATGDGVHASRLFADGREDVTGVVLVDPSPVGFQALFDDMVSDSGAPPWADIDATTSGALDDFGETPLSVIGQDPEAVFLSEGFVAAFGETAETLNDAWQHGLAFYASLSTESRSVVAKDTGMHMVIWDQPDLVIAEILDVIRAGTHDPT